MARKFKNDKFLVIEGTEAEFAAIGFGFQVQFVGRILVCDHCNEQIAGRKCYYIPVLNGVMCEECFSNWIETAEHFPEDDHYEKVHFDGVRDKLDKYGLWENE